MDSPYSKAMNRFFAAKSNIKDNTIIITDKDDIYHIKKVLRLQADDRIIVSDQIQYEYVCRIKEMGPELLLEILEQNEFLREPHIRVTLFQGIPKQQKMEFVVQKCTELGLDTLVPVFMERTVVKDKGDYWKKVVRYQQIAEEAAKQSQRGVMPEVRQATTFMDMVERLSGFQLVLFPYEEEEETTIKEVLQGIEEGIKRIAIIIGPEGGFSKEEAEMIIGQGGIPLSLGKTILRTETAGMAALAMTMYELEL